MKIKAIILTAAIFMMTSAVCFAEISPNESMQKICNAFLYLDEADLKSLNSSPDQMRKSYISGFENSDGDIKFTGEQSERITDALIEQVRQKVKFDVKTESVSGNKAVVAVTITGINLNETISKISFDATNVPPEKLSEVATNEIISELKNVSPKAPVTVKFNFVFDENNGMWFPEGEGDNLNPLFEAAFA